MSAVNPSISDREYEALRRAQKAHEPSMEEILASIRSIIAEERGSAKPLEPKNPAGKATAAGSPQVVYSRPDTPPRAPAAPPHRAEPSPAAIPPTDVERQPEQEGTGSSDRREDARPLLSPETDRAVASAFDSLSANVAARSAELAERMVRETLRPMLKAWLDQNLPGIVERLVSAEIDRVVKGTR